MSIGDTSVLRYEDAERPRPGRDEVLLKVAAAAFNTVDGWFRAGYVQDFFPVTFPLTLGLDVSGTVVEVGEGVEDPPVGRDVIGFLPMTTQGADAEYVAAPAGILVDAPSNISIEDAAAIPVAALTAWQSLFELGDLRAGQRVLINGAGGGVGTFAVQLAKAAGRVCNCDSERAKSQHRPIFRRRRGRRLHVDLGRWGRHRAGRPGRESGRRYRRGHRIAAQPREVERQAGHGDVAGWRLF